MKRILSPLALALTLCTQVAFAAEEPTREIYLSIMPDGTRRYGESPDPGAKQVKKLLAGPAQTGSGIITVNPSERTFVPPNRGGGGVATLPSPPHPIPEPAQTGALQRNATDMPKRSY